MTGVQTCALPIFNTEGTDALCDTVLSLPIHPYITEDDINTVVSAIEKNLK